MKKIIFTFLIAIAAISFTSCSKEGNAYEYSVKGHYYWNNDASFSGNIRYPMVEYSDVLNNIHQYQMTSDSYTFKIVAEPGTKLNLRAFVGIGGNVRVSILENGKEVVSKTGRVAEVSYIVP